MELAKVNQESHECTSLVKIEESAVHGLKSDCTLLAHMELQYFSSPSIDTIQKHHTHLTLHAKVLESREDDQVLGVFVWQSEVGIRSEYCADECAFARKYNDCLYAY